MTLEKLPRRTASNRSTKRTSSITTHLSTWKNEGLQTLPPTRRTSSTRTPVTLDHLPCRQTRRREARARVQSRLPPASNLLFRRSQDRPRARIGSKMAKRRQRKNTPLTHYKKDERLRRTTACLLHPARHPCQITPSLRGRHHRLKLLNSEIALHLNTSCHREWLLR